MMAVCGAGGKPQAAFSAGTATSSGPLTLKWLFSSQIEALAHGTSLFIVNTYNTEICKEP